MISKSIKNLKENISRTNLTIESFLSCVAATSALEEWLNEGKSKPFQEDEMGKQMKKHIDHAKDSHEGLYEMGFVKIFADFESFMYEFLVEKYKNYPNSIDNSTKLDIKDILDEKNIKDLKKKIIDEAATSDSWTIELWEEKLKNKFSISIFSDKRTRELFLILNEARNIILHSNGRATVKTLKKLHSLNAPSLKHGEKIPLTNKKLFQSAYSGILTILENIQHSLKK